ncbi:hypothetical protein HMPREF9622_02065 [Cutibacterium modestum HL037PA3]|nr:hypothetical protein HMPREF9622_02065 [Cutibacterium modestum HL037PA3]
MNTRRRHSHTKLIILNLSRNTNTHTFCSFAVIPRSPSGDQHRCRPMIDLTRCPCHCPSSPITSDRDQPSIPHIVMPATSEHLFISDQPQ